ncbi:hypothetical protein H8784_17990 [Parabacteroides acidifaciens]|uniref:Beta-mannosidase-like galactose-binding domain-containing protein n=1 Tax=Parabacteroides acidifaciens TaxID=2290935 RepID=A0A3D8H9K3_9BACT|nr:glycosyl hydrolase [Parabacteroides acidifaciens]MBC8603605.1 hypothetical protein [Parabacteroides acidifaciens]RDU47663.1 hypothetical protein DWU89_18430 [Parabacteroides acidifaciens]
MEKLHPVRRLLYTAFLLLSVCILSAQVPVVPSPEVLDKPFGEADRAAFSTPDKVFYPETWFHYIGGNVSLKGITADLEAIAAAGFSGIQLFHGQFGTVWPGTDSQIACLSPLWDHAVKHTAEECKRLGLRFTMQGCPGWAMAGGPWIKPENAMRHLVWSRTDVTAGTLHKQLPIPQPSGEDWRDYRDVVVLAFPTPDGDTGEPLQADGITSNVECNWTDYLQGKAEKPLNLSPAANGPYWLEIAYPEETVVRTIELSSVRQMNHSWCFEPGVSLKMEAVMPEGGSVEVLNTEMPQSNWQDDRTISLSCREVKGAKKYRISIVNKHDMALQSLRLFSAARKNNWESEAAWTLRTMERKGDAIRYADDAYLHTGQIYDLTGKMNADGLLEWEAPAGKWTILRVGHVNTGMKNGPAPAEGTGWECDKFSLDGSNAQFDGYLGRLSNGPLAGGLLKGVLFDSWECRTQTWTARMEEEFEKRTRYPLRKWLPALFGYVVDDPETTTRFLNDWRQVINGLFVDNFFGNMANRAKEQGMSISYETAAGDVFPADILEYYKYADVPMCEFWQPMTENYVGSLNFKPIKPATSAARIYGKPRVAAEAFTSFSHTWDESFPMLKEVANVNSIEGVTHLIFHTYTHNPQVGFLPPGTSFSGAGIGTPFLRGQTWWKYMPDFTTYLARCGYLLERGKPVSDVLWYLGDEIDHKPDQEFPFPAGFKYDYCNTDVLLNRLSVRDGRIVMPEGISYSVLWLPETTRMLPETVEKLYALIDAGAIVIGDAPAGLATLMGGKEASDRLNKAVRRIWTAPGIHTIGKGRIVSGMPLDKSLAALNLQPDVRQTDALWSHRRAGDTDWYYVCAPKGKGFKGTLDFRVSGNVQLWNPVNGEMNDIPVRSVDGRTQVQLDLPQSGSCFLVFNAPGSPVQELRERQLVSTLPLNSPWELRFPEGWGAPASISLPVLKSWKDLDIPAEGKAFSGTATYSTQFEVKKIDKNRTYRLDLGDVQRIAEVYLNGQKVGVAWTMPYEMDVTSYLKKGKNTLVVKVTNTWFNRLVYDVNRPEAERKTWVLKWPDKDAPLRDSGLLGPVSLKIEQ